MGETGNPNERPSTQDTGIYNVRAKIITTVKWMVSTWMKLMSNNKKCSATPYMGFLLIIN